MRLFFNFLIIFVWSFIINCSIFYFFFWGFGGKYLKNLLLNKIYKNDFVWFNKFLFFFIVFYLIMIFNIHFNPIYLDSIFELKLDDMKFSISGDYLHLIVTHFGSTSAFLMGVKLGAAFVQKHPMSIPTKIGTVLASGSASSLTFNMVNVLNGRIRGTIEGNIQTDNSVSLLVKNVNVSRLNEPILSETNTTNLSNEITQSISSFLNKNLTLHDKNLLGTKFINYSNSEDLSKKWAWAHLINKKQQDLELPLEQGNSELFSVADMNQFREEFYKEILQNTEDITMTDPTKIESTMVDSTMSDYSIMIDSPLEKTVDSADILSSTLKSDLVIILSHNFLINLAMIYLLCVLTFAFTIRFVVNHDLLLNKVKSLVPHPYGKILHSILNKLLNLWKNASVLWIYFMLFFLIIFSCASAYAMYGCLFIIEFAK